ncbi:MAG: RimK/LysX family protein [Candidatus Scalindua sp.]|nr:RimK/LysX family protein [Candidatus Scalindua sp.]
MKQKIKDYFPFAFLLILLMSGCSLIDTIKGEFSASKKNDSDRKNETIQQNTTSTISSVDLENTRKSEILQVQENTSTGKSEVIKKSSDEVILVPAKLKDEQDAAIRQERQLPVYGYVENVLLGPGKLQLKAKLDSGAKTSSLNVLDLVEFERDGSQWVRFKMIDPSVNEEVEFERKIERHVKIKQYGAESERRPVIMMEVQLGTIHLERAFTLTKRSDFIYKVLIGRNVLNGFVLIDTSRTFTTNTGLE